MIMNNPLNKVDDENKSSHFDQESSPRRNHDGGVASMIVPNTDSQDCHERVIARQLLLGNATCLLPFLRPPATTTIRSSTLSAEDQRERIIAILDEALSIVSSDEEDDGVSLPFATDTSHALVPNQ